VIGAARLAVGSGGGVCRGDRAGFGIAVAAGASAGSAVTGGMERGATVGVSAGPGTNDGATGITGSLTEGVSTTGKGGGM
jgi:hypothetical protein